MNNKKPLIKQGIAHEILFSKYHFIDSMGISCGEWSMLTCGVSTNYNPIYYYNNVSEDSHLWVKNVIANHCIQGNCSQKVVNLSLHPSEVNKYLLLQKEIARIIPIEESRPVIDLEVRGNAVDSKTNSYGILGGVGPVSDAIILVGVISKLIEKQYDIETIRINLYSNPPPRSLTIKLKRGLSYIRGLRKFFNRDHQKIWIASNSAHSRYEVLRDYMGGGERLVHMVNRVVHKLHSSLPEDSHVMIIGTENLYNSNLYPNLLREKGIDWSSPKLRTQRDIQAIINHTKAGEDGKATELYNLFQKNVKENVTHMVFACTELHLCLKVDGWTLKDLEDQIGVTIFDSEGEFIQLISDGVSS